MSFPEPETTGNVVNRTSVPLPGSEVVGVLLQNGLRILGGASDFGPNAPPGVGGVDPWQGSGDLFGQGSNGSMPSASDIGSAVSSLIGSYLGGEHGSSGVISPDIAALLKQLENIAGRGNIGAQFGPAGGSKQSAIDDIIVQIAGQILGPQVGGDPSRGKVPGFSQQHDVTIISDAVQEALNAARTKGEARQANMKAAQSYDPQRGDPLHGAPVHPTWWSEPTHDDLMRGVRSQEDEAEEEAQRQEKQAREQQKSDIKKVVLGVVIGAAAAGIICLLGGISAAPAVAGLVVLGGFMGGYLAYRLVTRMPGPDDGGGGPRSFSYQPDPESGSGGGPRGVGAMPDPESGSGGGPHGINYFPDPDSGGGVGPRS